MEKNSIKTVLCIFSLFSLSIYSHEFYELMDSPTIKTDNLYSFSPLIDQVFETVIAM